MNNFRKFVRNQGRSYFTVILTNGSKYVVRVRDYSKFGGIEMIQTYEGWEWYMDGSSSDVLPDIDIEATLKFNGVTRS